MYAVVIVDDPTDCPFRYPYRVVPPVAVMHACCHVLIVHVVVLTVVVPLDVTSQ